LEVAEGVLQLEIPMRHNPLGYTFSYLLVDSGTIIDTGVPTGDASRAMEAQLREGGLGVGDLKRVILTHLHRDHVGLVEHLKSASGAEVCASRKAFERQEAMKGLWGDMYSATRRDLEMMGGGSFIELLSRFEHAFRGSPEPVPIDVTLDDGEALRLGSASLRVVWTPGHAPEHICLYDADRLLLFSGDHVLPKITSHVSLHTYEDADPLADYLRSLSKVRDLPVEKVLPGHEHARARVHRPGREGRAAQGPPQGEVQRGEGGPQGRGEDRIPGLIEDIMGQQPLAAYELLDEAHGRRGDLRPPGLPQEQGRGRRKAGWGRPLLQPPLCVRPTSRP